MLPYPVELAQGLNERSSGYFGLLESD